MIRSLMMAAVVMAVTAGRTAGSHHPPDATEQSENWLAVEEVEGGTRSSFVVPVGGWFYYGPGEVHLEKRAENCERRCLAEDDVLNALEEPMPGELLADVEAPSHPTPSQQSGLSD